MESVILIVTNFIAWLGTPQGTLVLAALFGISEALASFPGVEANSIFQLLRNGINWLKGKFIK